MAVHWPTEFGEVFGCTYVWEFVDCGLKYGFFHVCMCILDHHHVFDPVLGQTFAETAVGFKIALASAFVFIRILAVSLCLARRFASLMLRLLRQQSLVVQCLLAALLVSGLLLLLAIFPVTTPVISVDAAVCVLKVMLGILACLALVGLRRLIFLGAKICLQMAQLARLIFYGYMVAIGNIFRRRWKGLLSFLFLPVLLVALLLVWSVFWTLPHLEDRVVSFAHLEEVDTTTVQTTSRGVRAVKESQQKTEQEMMFSRTVTELEKNTSRFAHLEEVDTTTVQTTSQGVRAVKESQQKTEQEMMFSRTVTELEKNTSRFAHLEEVDTTTVQTTSQGVRAVKESQQKTEQEMMFSRTVTELEKNTSRFAHLEEVDTTTVQTTSQGVRAVKESQQKTEQEMMFSRTVTELEKKTSQESMFTLCEQHYFADGFSPTCPPGYYNKTKAELEAEEIKRQALGVLAIWTHQLPWENILAVLTNPLVGPNALTAVMWSIKLLKLGSSMVSGYLRNFPREPIEPEEAWARYCSGLEPKNAFALLLRGKLSLREAHESMWPVLTDMGYYAVDTFNSFGGTQELAFLSFEKAALEKQRIAGLLQSRARLSKDLESSSLKIQELGQDLQAAVFYADVAEILQRPVRELTPFHVEQLRSALRFFKYSLQQRWDIVLKEAFEMVLTGLEKFSSTAAMSLQWSWKLVKNKLDVWKLVPDVLKEKVVEKVREVLVESGLDQVRQAVEQLSLQAQERVRKVMTAMQKEKTRLLNLRSKIMDNAQQVNAAEKLSVFYKRLGQGLEVANKVMEVAPLARAAWTRFENWWNDDPEAETIQCLA